MTRLNSFAGAGVAVVSADAGNYVCPSSKTASLACYSSSLTGPQPPNYHSHRFCCGKQPIPLAGWR